MTHSRLLTISGVLMASATITLAQPAAPPAPPAPPVPAAAPAPAAAPVAVAVPDINIDLDQVITPEFQDRLDQVRERMNEMRFEFDRTKLVEVEAARAGAEAARVSTEAVREAMRNIGPAIADATRGIGVGIGRGFAFAPQIAPMPPTPPTPAMGAGRGRIYVSMSPDRAYSSGQSALDAHRWEDAVNAFTQVINRGTNRVDGALYWKAYALAKLGKRDEALATIAELRKSHANSRWLDDAKALEIEVNQGVKPMSPEAEADESMKLLILSNGLSSGVQADFDRFFPALEKLIKSSSSSPRVKREALYVLAQSPNTKAQAMLEQIARGGGNPDLQVKAINYLTQRRRNTPANANTGQLLGEIYAATTDTEVKRAALQGLVDLKDKDRLIALLKSEKNQDLRGIPIRYFGEIQGNAELWQLYGSETTPEGKILILQNALSNGNPDKLMDVIRNEKDTKVRTAAIRALASYSSATDQLVSIYGNEQDTQVKQAIMDRIFESRNGKAMVDLAKAEKDQKMKIRMIERMSGRRDCKECQDYLLEILNK